MSTSSTLKLALELAAKVTGHAGGGDLANVRLRLPANRTYAHSVTKLLPKRQQLLPTVDGSLRFTRRG